MSLFPFQGTLSPPSQLEHHHNGSIFSAAMGHPSTTPVPTSRNRVRLFLGLSVMHLVQNPCSRVPRRHWGMTSLGPTRSIHPSLCCWEEISLLLGDHSSMGQMENGKEQPSFPDQGYPAPSQPLFSMGCSLPLDTARLRLPLASPPLP